MTTPVEAVGTAGRDAETTLNQRCTCGEIPLVGARWCGACGGELKPDVRLTGDAS